MSGLKSGSGDDLWGDEDDEEVNDEEPGTTADAEPEATPAERGPESTGGTDRESDSKRDHDQTAPTGGAATAESDSSAPGMSSRNRPEGTTPEDPESSGADRGTTRSSGGKQPYIVRRAIEDKSVQFERDERLTFFVHGDVADGERELASEMEAALGRNLPKFDVREAVYRAALRNREDVLDELLAMGYTLEEE